MTTQRPVSLPLIYAGAYALIGYGVWASRHFYAVLLGSLWSDVQVRKRARQ